MTVVALTVSAVMVVVTAIMRAAGASLVRTPRAVAARDAAEGDEGAAVVADLLEDRPRLQPALGGVHTALLVLAAIPATWTLTRILDGWVLLAALVVLGLLLVVVGDLVPRKLGRDRPGALAYRFAGLLKGAVALGAAATDFIDDLDDDDDEDVDEDAVDAEEAQLITSVLEFSDTIVREVMTPRTDMVCVRANESTDHALDVVLEAGRSRVPVLGEGTDDILGVLYARDLLKLMDDEAEARPSRLLMRTAYFVPETKRVPELLREMQANQVHLAVVVDEFGGTAGLVTIEDLLEELVGEIVDEYDDEEPLVTLLDEGGYLIDGRMGVDELEELLGVELPDDEWDTVGGLLLGLAGRVPKEGESFDYDAHVFTAERVQGRRVARVRLRAR
jgi:CBS domain containing-hemolysin-like protein